MPESRECNCQVTVNINIDAGKQSAKADQKTEAAELASRILAITAKRKLADPGFLS